MRTTLLLDDDVHRRAKHLAVDQGRTLTSVFDQALRDYLDKHGSGRPFSVRDVATGSGGLLVEADHMKLILHEEDVEHDLGEAP
ncbi:MAG: hypothetical protein LBK59_08295 [Bifidobacteriaceae bacterium]|jgi:predicted transcriptional regulator|nr:hypothetical protein [Bifidobacteriaceae bacterium]